MLVLEGPISPVASALNSYARCRNRSQWQLNKLLRWPNISSCLIAGWLWQLELHNTETRVLTKHETPYQRGRQRAYCVRGLF